jgi:hypothetical protein
MVKQETLVPSLPLQLQVQGPLLEPQTPDPVPVVQSPVVGAVEAWTAAAGPHWLEARSAAQAAHEISGKMENIAR